MDFGLLTVKYFSWVLGRSRGSRVCGCNFDPARFSVGPNILAPPRLGPHLNMGISSEGPFSEASISVAFDVLYLVAPRNMEKPLTRLGLLGCVPSPY